MILYPTIERGQGEGETRRQGVPPLLVSPSPSLPLSPAPPLSAIAAVANARRRWPDLAEPLRLAGELVAQNALYALPAGLEELALCRPSADSLPVAIRASPTGLACSCNLWPPPYPAGPGDGCCCPHILAYLLTLYLQRPLPPLPFDPEALWLAALDDLQHETLKAVYDLWLRDTRAIPAASSPTRLTVAARDRRACEWISCRLYPVVARAVARAAGYPITLRFV